MTTLQMKDVHYVHLYSIHIHCISKKKIVCLSKILELN